MATNNHIHSMPLPAATTGITFWKLPPDNTPAPMSIEERLDALEKKVHTYKTGMEDVKHNVEQLGKGVDRFGREVDECSKQSKKLKQDVEQFAEDNVKERAAWRETEKVVGKALVAVAAVALHTASRTHSATTSTLQSNYRGPSSGPRRTLGRQ